MHTHAHTCTHMHTHAHTCTHKRTKCLRMPEESSHDLRKFLPLKAKVCRNSPQCTSIFFSSVAHTA